VRTPARRVPFVGAKAAKAPAQRISETSSDCGLLVGVGECVEWPKKNSPKQVALFEAVGGVQHVSMLQQKEMNVEFGSFHAFTVSHVGKVDYSSAGRVFSSAFFRHFSPQWREVRPKTVHH
jgi:hypothetical protein